MFIDRVTVKEVVDFCYKEPPFSTSSNHYDPRPIGLQIKMDIEGLDFDLSIYVGGSPNPSATKANKRWGSAWKVKELLDEFGLKAKDVMKADEKGVIRFDEAALNKALAGRPFYKVSYVADSGKRREYDRIAAVQPTETDEKAKQRIKKRFEDDVAGGWIKLGEKPADGSATNDLPQGIFDPVPPDPDDDTIPF